MKEIKIGMSQKHEEILEEERLIQTLMVQTEDYKKGVAALKEKRKPAFKGR
jgi:2-(1,2-epoxy-1,2-dihydrophenyl)acetyl-CoA isomerase